VYVYYIEVISFERQKVNTYIEQLPT